MQYTSVPTTSSIGAAHAHEERPPFPADPRAEQRPGSHTASDRPSHDRPPRPGVRPADQGDRGRPRPRLRHEGLRDRVPVLGHRRLGGGDRQHAPARRQDPHVRDGPVRGALAQDGRAPWARDRPRAGRLAPRGRSCRGRVEASRGPGPHHPRRGGRHNETSTGVASRIPLIRQAIDRAGHDALLFVDTISSLASLDYRHHEWGGDVTVSCSQKGLMLPPGLGFNAISDKALTAAKKGGMPRSYWDWEEMLKSNATGFFPYPPATKLLYTIRQSVTTIRPPCFARRASRTSSRGTHGTPRRHAARSGAGSWRSSARCRRSTRTCS